MFEFLLTCLRFLPIRVQRSLYHRFFIYRTHRYAGRFEAAPLKLAPCMVMKLSPVDGFHGEIALFGMYEEITSQLIHAIAGEKGGLLVDVGANYGYYSLLWCAARSENCVLAVEASPANIGPLNHNVVLNHLEDRITVHEWAASRKEADEIFTLGSTVQTGWGGIAPSASLNPVFAEDMKVSVRGHRLDVIFSGQDIAVLKVDCEGADAWVIEGASGLLAEKRIAHIFFEENLHRQSELGIELGAALRTLEAFGYQWKNLDSDSNTNNYHAWR